VSHHVCRALRVASISSTLVLTGCGHQASLPVEAGGRVPVVVWNLAFALGLAMFATGCSVLSVVSAFSPTGTANPVATEVFDAAHGLTLDIYKPKVSETEAPVPVVVFFYGGAWKDGSRQRYEFVASTLLEGDVMVVIPDYRLYPKVVFPAFVRDGAAAITWVQQNIGQYGGDPDNIFLMGHSSGAHIAALLYFDQRYLQNSGAALKPCGFVGLAGPYDFLPLASPEMQSLFPEQERAASQPVNFVTGEEGPVLLIHGLQDNRVKPRNSQSLANTITESGGRVDMLLYEKAGHVRVLMGLAKSFRWVSPVAADTLRFIKENNCSQ